MDGASDTTRAGGPVGAGVGADAQPPRTTAARIAVRMRCLSRAPGRLSTCRPREQAPRQLGAAAEVEMDVARERAAQPVALAPDWPAAGVAHLVGGLEPGRGRPLQRRVAELVPPRAEPRAVA